MSPRDAARLDVANPMLSLSFALCVPRVLAAVEARHAACEAEGFKTAQEQTLFGDEIVRCTSCCTVLPRECER